VGHRASLPTQRQGGEYSSNLPDALKKAKLPTYLESILKIKTYFQSAGMSQVQWLQIETILNQVEQLKPTIFTNIDKTHSELSIPLTDGSKEKVLYFRLNQELEKLQQNDTRSLIDKIYLGFGQSGIELYIPLPHNNLPDVIKNLTDLSLWINALQGVLKSPK
jgi:hypothetical protein